MQMNLIYDHTVSFMHKDCNLHIIMKFKTLSIVQKMYVHKFLAQKLHADEAC